MSIVVRCVAQWLLLFSITLAVADVALANDDYVFTASSSQPQNVGDAILAATSYHDLGQYQRDLAIIADKATAWILARAPKLDRPAVVFDIDETALSNWEIIKRDNFGRPIQGPCDLTLDGPCGWAAWDNLAASPALEPTLATYINALASKASIFFITGRPENQREATERNLRSAGYAGYTQLLMVPDGQHYASAVDFKAPMRAKIEADGYTIIANIGDQPSDLFGGHAERLFLLPNPFYRVP